MAPVLDAFKLSDLPILRLFSPAVPAGFPSPASDYEERPLDLNLKLMPHPAATFAVKAYGNSMVGVGIHSGDILIVDRSLNPKDGDIVIAAINGEFTVKRLSLKAKGVFLLSENPTHPPIPVPELADLNLFGVVKHVIHSF
jgi:DNA polymerase V